MLFLIETLHDIAAQLERHTILTITNIIFEVAQKMGARIKADWLDRLIWMI